MELQILPRDAAPAASQSLLDGIAADLGFVPNLAATVAASPTLLAAFDGLRRAVSDTSFDPVHREIAGLAVGVAVDNAYGVAFHSTVLGRLGVGETDLDAMRGGGEPRNEAQAAVYAFARALVLDRGAVDEAVVQRARDAGLTDADLLQLVTECVFASLVGLVDNLAGRVELDEFLQPRAWKERV
jgi:alkylhydroperoxidase family enzyme